MPDAAAAPAASDTQSPKAITANRMNSPARSFGQHSAASAIRKALGKVSPFELDMAFSAGTETFLQGGSRRGALRPHPTGVNHSFTPFGQAAVRQRDRGDGRRSTWNQHRREAG
jgi:hypothetical protein